MASEESQTSLSRDQAKRWLQQMDNWDFEHFIADLWERQGWQTHVEQQSGDAGVDIRAIQTTPFDQKVLIQAKRYGPDTTVSGPEVQQYAALKQQEPDTDYVIIATTSRFTDPAYERAAELNVKLIDGDDLVDLLIEYNAVDLLTTYYGSGTTPPTGTVTVNATRPTDDSSRFDGDNPHFGIIALALLFTGWGFTTALLQSTVPPLYKAFLWAGILVVPGTAIGIPVLLYRDAKELHAERNWRFGYLYLTALVGTFLLSLSPFYSSHIAISTWVLAVPLYLYHRPSTHS